MSLFRHRKPPQNPHGDPVCWSCQQPLNHASHCGAAGVEICQKCWQKIPIVDRVQIALQVLDRAPGGYLAELADALQRFEQHETDDWKSGGD